MFSSARIKLTLWYLAIIFCVSLLFSSFIYRGINAELVRLENIDNLIQTRIEQNLPVPRQMANSHIDPLLISEARNRIIFNLGFINLGILLFAGLAGYALAGQTLKPIAEMVDSLSRFVSDASHELRTPLTALRTEIEVGITDSKINLSKAKKLIASNLEEVIKLQTLTDSLLSLTEYEKQIKLSKLDLSEVVLDAVATLQILAKQKKISINHKLDESMVSGNYDSLRQVVTIILDNAIKYSHKGGTIDLMSLNNKKNIVLRIKDKGVGVAKEDMDRLFDRFYRGDVSRSTEGFGLGLSIAQKIMSSHKGEIAIASQKDDGTEVDLILPRIK